MVSLPGALHSVSRHVESGHSPATCKSWAISKDSGPESCWASACSRTEPSARPGQEGNPCPEADRCGAAGVGGSSHIWCVKELCWECFYSLIYFGRTGIKPRVSTCWTRALPLSHTQPLRNAFIVPMTLLQPIWLGLPWSQNTSAWRA
jgi:hypothetical protein